MGFVLFMSMLGGGGAAAFVTGNPHVFVVPPRGLAFVVPPRGLAFVVPPH